MLRHLLISECSSRSTAIDGLDGHAAPSTQHDIWVWIHGTGADVVLGFVDGAENPGPSDAARVASIADGRPGAGGSHVIAQRWVHDLDSFNHLEVNQQQEVVGRTKPDSVALPRDERPVDAHIMRAELLDDDGEERQIYRRSVPFGNAAERGLYFLGFSCERDRFDGMLARMFGTSGDGVHDHLLDFTRAVTGSYYFAPCVEDLTTVSALVTQS